MLDTGTLAWKEQLPRPTCPAGLCFSVRPPAPTAINSGLSTWAAETVWLQEDCVCPPPPGLEARLGADAGCGVWPKEAEVNLDSETGDPARVTAQSSQVLSDLCILWTLGDQADLKALPRQDGCYSNATEHPLLSGRWAGTGGHTDVPMHLSKNGN